MQTTLSIIIYVASPLDIARYRHTALYLQVQSEASPTPQVYDPTGTPISNSTLLEIIGGNGFFTFQERPDYVLPSPSVPPAAAAGASVGVRVEGPQVAKVVRVAELPGHVSPTAVRGAVMSTPINNGALDWNCQNWVGDALGRLVVRGLLQRQEREAGIDRMVEVCLEGADEGIE